MIVPPINSTATMGGRVLKVGDVVEYDFGLNIAWRHKIEGLFIIKSISGIVATLVPVGENPPGEPNNCLVFWLKKNQFMTDVMAARESQC